MLRMNAWWQRQYGRQAAEEKLRRARLKVARQAERSRTRARAASDSHMQVNAGHGINYENIALVNQIPCLTELNIGHAIISRALFTGLSTVVREYLGVLATAEGART